MLLRTHLFIHLFSPAYSLRFSGQCNQKHCSWKHTYVCQV